MAIKKSNDGRIKSIVFTEYDGDNEDELREKEKIIEQAEKELSENKDKISKFELYRAKKYSDK